MEPAELYYQIRCCCAGALLAEVSASPKPGLVDRYSSGAHRDMDFYTFLTSITAIAPYFEQCARVGAELEQLDGCSLDQLRPLGVECEKKMFAATKGVNTHKGAIFSLGIIAAAAGYCGIQLKDLGVRRVCTAASVIAQPAQRDFLRQEDKLTQGRKLYDRYGIRGIRGEAASGFESVRRYALPVLEELFSSGQYHENEIYLQTLLHLMAQVEDTNVLARCGMEGLAFLRASARELLEQGGALTPSGMTALSEMDRIYIEKNLSPGGCADLLSVAIVLYRLSHMRLS